MIYNEQMILQSKSGYCMPFEEQDGKDVQMTLGYGEQTHPQTGESFFHHGIDFMADHYLLSAVASGTVSGVGSDETHGIFQTVRYGNYEVTYAHLSNVYANFGQPVKAGQIVGLTDKMLHVGVKFNGEEMNPMDFLTMLFGNIKAMEQAGRLGVVEFDDLGVNIATKYDADKEEIEQLMLRFLPDYMEDLRYGNYIVPQHTEQSLRNIFSLSAMKHYFFELIPSMGNPLGIGQRAVPLASKVQNLLIGDFLNYLALRQGVFLSTSAEGIKKKPFRKPDEQRQACLNLPWREKVHEYECEQSVGSGNIIDPLAELDIDIQSFDIPRLVSVYPDRAGVRWWTKAWFNNHELGEASVEIERQQAIQFILDHIDKDEWLTEFFPKQMEVYRHAIEQTREQLLRTL